MALPIEPTAVQTLISAASGVTYNASEMAQVVTASQAGTKALGAGFAIGATGIAAAIAEYGIGTAAVGATAEKPELFGSVLILTVIPETIVIFGLVVALLLII